MIKIYRGLGAGGLDRSIDPTEAYGGGGGDGIRDNKLEKSCIITS